MFHSHTFSLKSNYRMYWFYLLQEVSHICDPLPNQLYRAPLRPLIFLAFGSDLADILASYNPTLLMPKV
jgi:hypothetical protein